MCQSSYQRPSLPIDASIATIVQSVRDYPITIISAPPGSGKTTRVAPALLDYLKEKHDPRKIYLLQPRRIAARSVALRISDEMQIRLGEEVGYHVRFDRKSRASTRLIVATEGILLRRTLGDPTLNDVSIVIMDEVHERSIDTDLLFGILQQIRQSIREDLKLVLMSATLDDSAIASISDSNCVRVEGRMYPVATKNIGSVSPLQIVDRTVQEVIRVARQRDEIHAGDMLVFLPGRGEIFRTRDRLLSQSEVSSDEILILHGSLPIEEQARVLQPSSRRKIILATNVAETSLTIDGVRVVIDSGFARIMRFDPNVGLNRLSLERISKSSATQRAGRAGRTAEGVCYRLWNDTTANCAEQHTEPEVLRIDLSAALLQLFAWGHSNIQTFPWLTKPRAEATVAATKLLERLGAINWKIDSYEITSLGSAMSRVPLPPRLSRMVIEGIRLGHSEATILAASMIAERDPFIRDDSSSSRSSAGRPAIATQRVRRWRSDVVERMQLIKPYARQSIDHRSGHSHVTEFGGIHIPAVRDILAACDDIRRNLDDEQADLLEGPTSMQAIGEEEAIEKSLLAGFPDRLAKRRGVGKATGVMVSGRAVKIANQSGVIDAELFLCIDVDADSIEATVRQASTVDRQWLDQGKLLRREKELFFHPSQMQVVARNRVYWDDLLIEETPTFIADEDRPRASAILHQAALQSWHNVFPSDDKTLVNLIARCKWLQQVAPESDVPILDDPTLREICGEMCDNFSSFPQLKKAPWIDWVLGRFSREQIVTLEKEVPKSITTPSGSTIALEYREDAPPILAVRIQEVFSWTESPRVAQGKVRVLLHLLAPNMRPQQITDDLASFWKNGYSEVKKELKRRYPKHSWPDDPATAKPSRGVLKK